MGLTNYNYHLPPDLIAQVPAVPRDSSRLFIYNTQTGEITFDRFYHLHKYLPEKSFLVLNKTKVVPVRVELRKTTGGKIIALLLINEISETGIVKTLVDRRVDVGEKLFIDKKHFFEVVGQKEKVFYLKSGVPIEWIINRLTKIGHTPVPLYLRKTPLSEKDLRKKYQTIFAQPARLNFGSIAAPTASLHFTDRVFSHLEKKGIDKLFVTLHVGLGTFAPITEENIKNKKLHEEYYEVDGSIFQSINRLKQEGKKLVAVGTTVTRTLESIIKLKAQNSKLKTAAQNAKLLGKTDLFIFPPFNFKMVDHLITNFHLPNSSLMMLVEAFLQYKKSKHTLVDLYNIAIKEKFRFYSFGDAMAII